MKSFEKNSIIFFVLFIIANLANYLFQIIMGRMLDTASFGILNSLISLYIIISVPNIIIMMVVSKYVTEYKTNNMNVDILIKHFLTVVLIISVLYIFLGFFLSGYISSFIKINEKKYVFYIFLASAFSLIMYIFHGKLQGEKRIQAFGIIGLVFPFTRLFGSIIFIFIGLNIYGIIFSFILGNILGIITGIIMNKFNIFIFKDTNKLQIKKETIKFVWITLLINVGLSFLTNIDIIMVKHFFTDEITGYYSAASILGKIILYVSGALVLVMFPYAVESVVKNDNKNKIFIKSLLYGGGLSVICAIGLNLFSKQAIYLLFGTRYVESNIYLLPITLWIIPLGLLTIICNYSLAVNKANILAYLLPVGCILSVCYIYLRQPEIVNILFTLASVSLFLFIIGVLSIIKGKLNVKTSINNNPG